MLFAYFFKLYNRVNPKMYPLWALKPLGNQEQNIGLLTYNKQQKSKAVIVLMVRSAMCLFTILLAI